MRRASEALSESVAYAHGEAGENPVSPALDLPTWGVSDKAETGTEAYLDSRRRRVVEIAIVVALIAALAPLLVVIAIAIRSSSPGPILFRQMRHGRGMQPFQVLKFRTMHWTSEEQGVVQAEPDDPRVTPLGRVLRRTSLDELPQLLNVLSGEMSLIGPRPHAVEHDRIYGELLPEYKTRFRARPGLTGLAQVSGARGCTPHLDDMRRRVHLDLKYIEHASWRADCSILLTTCREVFRSENAW